MTPYQYSDLDRRTNEIRLFDLLPGNFDDQICIQIYHAPLVAQEKPPVKRISLQELRKILPPGWAVYETWDNRFLFNDTETNLTSWTHPSPTFDRTCYEPVPETISNQYEALSYVWGTTEQPVTISVVPSQTVSDEFASLPVGQNLASALRHLRHTHRKRTLWIDAICINQDLVSERNEEVLRMGEIYKFASRVVVWLGPETGCSNLAMSTLDDLGQQVELSIDLCILPSPEAKQRNWHHRTVPLPYDDETWKALDLFLQCPWFERLWITQEITFGNMRSILQFGSNQMLWTIFRKAINVLYMKETLPPQLSLERLRAAIKLTDVFINRRYSVLDLVNDGRVKKCADPRDKVYGYLSLFPASFARQIIPNYSFPISEVYKRFSLTYLEHYQFLWLLQYCVPVDTLTDLPSWVLDLSRSYSFHPWDSWFLASGKSSSQLQYFPPKVLEVTGLIIGAVRTISVPLPHNADFDQALNTIRISKPSQRPEQRYYTGELALDVFVATWCVNRTQESCAYGSFPTLSEVKETLGIEDAVASTTRSEKQEADFRHICNDAARRAFFTSSEEHMGLCHPEAKSGDIICVLLGCRTPMLLRPCTPSINLNIEYQIIGSCYVHGIMYAESILGPLRHPWKVQSILNHLGYFVFQYVNNDTGEHTLVDPRLGAMPAEWVDDYSGDYLYRNTVTGEKLKGDPRLLPEALEARGVILTKFRLV